MLKDTLIRLRTEKCWKGVTFVENFNKISLKNNSDIKIDLPYLTKLEKGIIKEPSFLVFNNIAELFSITPSALEQEIRQDNHLLFCFGFYLGDKDCYPKSYNAITRNFRIYVDDISDQYANLNVTEKARILRKFFNFTFLNTDRLFVEELYLAENIFPPVSFIASETLALISKKIFSTSYPLSETENSINKLDINILLLSQVIQNIFYGGVGDKYLEVYGKDKYSLITKKLKELSFNESEFLEFIKDILDALLIHKNRYVNVTYKETFNIPTTLTFKNPEV